MGIALLILFLLSPFLLLWIGLRNKPSGRTDKSPMIGLGDDNNW